MRHWGDEVIDQVIAAHSLMTRTAQRTRRCLDFRSLAIKSNPLRTKSVYLISQARSKTKTLRHSAERVFFEP